MADLNLKIPAVEKLLEFVASGIGAVGGPLLARWKANREADAARIEAQGQADVMRIKVQGQADSMDLIADAQVEARNRFPIADASIQGKVDIGKEVESRFTFQEQKRQSNIGTVVRMAADELNDKQIENHDIDHDWVARFFADVQDVTSEHMQRIWARILAGEVETSGRTSLHTLSILKNMTQRDAKLFENISRFVFNGFILREKHAGGVIGFPTYDTLIDMKSYGLLNTGTFLNVIMKLKPQRMIFNNTDIYKISVDSEFQKIDIPCSILSPQGRELYKIVEPSIDETYLRAIARFMNDNGDIKLERARIIEKLPNNKIRHTPWILVEPLYSSQDHVGT